MFVPRVLRYLLRIPNIFLKVEFKHYSGVIFHSPAQVPAGRFPLVFQDSLPGLLNPHSAWGPPVFIKLPPTLRQNTKKASVPHKQVRQAQRGVLNLMRQL